MSRFEGKDLDSVLDVFNVDASTENFMKKWKTPDALADALHVSLDEGIRGDADDLEDRVAFFGDNVLPRPEGDSFLSLFMDTFNDATVIILLISASVSLAVGIYEDPVHGWIEGATIFVAILIVSLVTATNDYSKQEQLRKLSYINDDVLHTVIRDGSPQRVRLEKVVVGDIVRLEAGCSVPADGIFITGSDLTVDESSLTGESDLLPKGAPGSDKGGCFMLSNTKVCTGFCNMLVLRVGQNSSLGIISGMIGPAKGMNVQTPLQEKLEVLAEQIGYVGMVAAAATFAALLGIWYFYPDQREHNLVQQLIKATIMAVAIVAVAVPEGLPLAVAISLAFSSGKMMKDNNLIRHLSACETMGNATNICSDKTGTLTLAHLTFTEGFIAGERVHAAPKKRTDITDQLAANICSNSTVMLSKTPDGRRNVIGNPTEGALFEWLDDLGYDVMGMSKESFNPDAGDRVFAFSSLKKRMSTLRTRGGRLKHNMLYVKGAAEHILADCTHYLKPRGVASKMDASMRNYLHSAIEDMASGKLRVLAIAERRVNEGDKEAEREHLEKDLTLLALFGIEDPLRPDVPAAVETCKQAGIAVRMITGDNIHTATAIAKECGILTQDGVAMEGSAFRALTPAQLDDVLPRLQVLARATPQDKFDLVTRLNGVRLPRNEDEWKEAHPGGIYRKDKDHILPGYREEWERVYHVGEVVGVTGDGTNDAPALSAADVGLSMGLTGTQVAKDASDIVIMDDNFSSIVKAVMWGRSVFANIRKFLQFQLTVNVVALLITFYSALKGGDPPITPVMMLWINLIMDTLGALALGTEVPSTSLLNGAPYKRDASLINAVMWRNILVQAIFQIALLVYLLDPAGAEDFGVEFRGGDDRKHQTIVFNVFVLCQVFNEFNARRLGDDFNVFEGVFTNAIFIAVIAVTLGVQYLLVKYGGDFMKTSDLNSDQWYKSFLLASLTIPMGAIMRLIPITEDPSNFAKTVMYGDDLKKMAGEKSMAKDGSDTGLTPSFLVWTIVVVAAPAMVWEEFKHAWTPRLLAVMA